MDHLKNFADLEGIHKYSSKAGSVTRLCDFLHFGNN